MSQYTQKRLNAKQLKLIDALAEGLDIGEVMKRCRITPATFHKWVTGEEFEQELRFRQDTARRQSELLLGKNAYKAAEKLVNLMDEKEKPDVVRRACLDILSLTGRAIIPSPSRKKKSNQSEKPLDESTASAMLELLSKKSAS